MFKTLAIAAAVLVSHGCKGVDCGDGTLERNGTCVPADESVGTAKCGKFTKLVGDQCVPEFPPTVCDDGTTDPSVDTSTGVTTCLGNGAVSCASPLACPAPTAGKQTICGQLYDMETGQPFQAAGATGAKCGAATATGPCGLDLHAFDAVQFASNPQTAQPLPPTNMPGNVYIDDCGRYKIEDISVPTNPFIAIGVDDADMAKMGPAGLTNASGVATPKVPSAATKDLEAFVVPKSTTDKWEGTGGPPLSGGMLIEIFRTNKTGLANEPMVTITKNGGTIPNNDFYFSFNNVTRTTVDMAATSTGMNGTAIVTNASIFDGVMAYSATMGNLPAGCKWDAHAGASLPFIVFTQIFRPIDSGAAGSCAR